MKKGLFILTLFISFAGAAQTNLDSLWTIWNDSSQPDTNRLKAMKRISWDGYLFTQPDSAFYFAQLQYELAEQKNEKQHMADAQNTQGVSFYFQGDYAKAINYYTKSLATRKKIQDKKGTNRHGMDNKTFAKYLDLPALNGELFGSASKRADRLAGLAFKG